MMIDKTGIYIHIPFCASKCAYCDFVSYSGKEEMIPAYFKALANEIRSFHWDGEISTIYIGGGTPSFVDKKYILSLLDSLKENFSLAENCEISMESNPNSLSEDKLEEYRKGGVNRISLGVQSTDNEVLSKVGRTHNAEEAFRTVESIKAAGFENFNLDLMFSLPGQSIASFEESLRFALQSKAKHISCYALSVEENTPIYELYSKGVYSIDEQKDREMYHTAVDMLSSAGLARYEISNFAQKGYECRHNVDCWDFRNYVGFGAAAHSFIKGVRYANTPKLDEYIGFWRAGCRERREAVESFVCEENRESLSELMGDYNMTSLRTVAGIDSKAFGELFKEDFYEKYKAPILRFCENGLMFLREGRYALTDKGFDFANTVMMEFI